MQQIPLRVKQAKLGVHRKTRMIYRKTMKDQTLNETKNIFECMRLIKTTISHIKHYIGQMIDIFVTCRHNMHYYIQLNMMMSTVLQ